MLKTMTTEEKFRAAVNVIKSLPKDGPYQPSNEMKLTFYGLYKQATEGPCTEPKPSFFQVIAGYKWQAWNSLGQISKEEAMERYIAELKKQIVETMSYSTDVASFMEALGPFYEYVDMPSKAAHHDTEDSTDMRLPDAEQQLCLQTPLSSATGDESADSAVSLEYEVPERLSKVGVNGLHSPNGIVQEIMDCSDQVHLLKGSLRNGSLRNGDVKRNGVVSRGTFPPPDPDVARERPTTPHAAATEREHLLRSARPVSSDTESEDEYAMPPEEMSGDECVVMNGVTIDGTPSPSQHHHPHNDTSLELNTGPVPTDPLQFRMCDSGASGLADTGSGSDRSSAGDMRAGSSVHSTTKIPDFSPFHSRSNSNPAFTLLENSQYMITEGHNRNMSATPQVVDSGTVVREQGGPRGGGGGDDVVLVLRQMQGDLQAMTQCLQAHLNDISQCLAALNRTSIALQAHSEGAGGGGGGSGGAMSPVSDVVQRRQRQWWPFPELSPRSTFWLLLWPVLLHVAVHACKLALRMRLRRKK